MTPRFKRSQKKLLRLQQNQIRKNTNNESHSGIVRKKKIAWDEVDYDDFFNAKLPWNCTDKSKTPLVVLSNRELTHLRKNCVVLKQMRIVNENKQGRKIFYDDLEYLGNNIVTKKANNDVIVKLPETKRNFFCILGLVKDVKKFCKGVELFCSRGYRLNTMAWMSPYTLLCFACAGDSWKKSGCLHVDKEQLSIVSKFMTNQLSGKQFKKHFNSSGKVYSYGHTARYDAVDKEGLSFQKYATKSDIKSNKVFEDTINHLIVEQNRLIAMMERYYLNLKKIFCPDISKLHWQFELDNDNISVFKQLNKYGIINFHICINAQTDEFHTEHDSSYTILTVPRQTEVDWKKQGARFQFQVNENLKFQLPMTPCVGIFFSGYLLTHRQQISTKNPTGFDFINFGTYCNRRLFNNMMMSFRRQVNPVIK